MDARIIALLARKRSRPQSESSSSAPPTKKAQVSSSAPHLPALPALPAKQRPEGSSSKSRKDGDSTKDDTSPADQEPTTQKKEHPICLDLYKGRFDQVAKPKFVRSAEKLDLSELGKYMEDYGFRMSIFGTCLTDVIADYEKKSLAKFSKLQKQAEKGTLAEERCQKLQDKLSILEMRLGAANSQISELKKELERCSDNADQAAMERDNLKTAFDKMTESHSSEKATLIAQLSESIERADKEYISGVAFSCSSIMTVLKKKYPELDMDRLAAGIDAYMEEQDKEDVEQNGAADHGDVTKQGDATELRDVVVQDEVTKQGNVVSLQAEVLVSPLVPESVFVQAEALASPLVPGPAQTTTDPGEANLMGRA